jgi:hypothetical protein
MPKDNLVSASLPAADVQAVSDALATIRAKLPFLIDLTPQDRRRLLKMGDGSRAFVEKALTAAQGNPQVFPPSFNVAEYARDLTLWGQLGPIATQVTQLAELLDDTQVALGSDLMNAAVTAYGYLNQATTGGLEEVRAELGKRFERGPSSPEPGPSTPPSPAVT